MSPVLTLTAMFLMPVILPSAEHMALAQIVI
jgi:hypothetical protein